MSETEKKHYKDRILTEVFKKGEVHEKVLGICNRNRIKKETYIHEDVLSETFYHLSKYNTDTLIEMYEDNPKRIIGLAVRIAIWKGVIKDNKNPNYHKHSVARNILFASNLSSFTSATDTTEDGDNYMDALVDDSTVEENDLWEVIYGELSKEEVEFLTYILNLKKGRGKYKKEIKDKKDNLMNRIREIIEKNKIIV